MRVLVACEFSGIVRDAFTAAGHDAMSCDIRESEAPGKHFQGDVLELQGEPFDLVIAHPPCTYLANSGVRWLHSDPNRWHEMESGAKFFREMLNFNSPRIAIENPVQHKYAKSVHGMGDPSQSIQPWQFGHPETKRICLWLYGLPILEQTDNVKHVVDTMSYSERSRIHYMSPGPNREKERSKFYPGIATAMAEQWGR